MRSTTARFMASGLLLMVAIFASVDLGAQSSTASYAQRIVKYADRGVIAADSIWIALNVTILPALADKPTPYSLDSARAIASHARRSIRRFKGDFDAVAPATGFERVHLQLIAALDALETSADDLSRKVMPCTSIQCTTSIITASSVYLRARSDYTDARKRASTLLQAKSVKLAAEPKLPDASSPDAL